MAYDDDIWVHGLQGKARPDEEMVGHEEILGDEILGAVTALASKIKGGAAFQNALAARLAKRSPIVQKVQPTKKRRFTVGFGPAVIPPGAFLSVQAQPQELFRGEKIIDTTPGGAAGIFIQGLFVGAKSQLPTFQNPISMLTYGPGVLDNEQLLDTCDPALFITFQLQNTTGVTVTWSASVIGHTVL